MLRITFFCLLLFLGVTALAPGLTEAAGEGKPESGDIGKLLNERLSDETADSAKQEQIALAKAKRQKIMTEGNAVLKDIDTLQATMQRWENQMNALLTNAEGQALATDPVNVEHFIDLQQVERYPLSQLEGMRSEIQTLLTPIQTASDDTLSVPGDALVTAIRNKSKEVKDALDQYGKLQSKLNVLLQKTKGIQVTTGSPTLEAVIQKVGEDQAQRELEAREIVKNKARHEADKRITEEETKKILAETELKRQLIENERKRLEEEKERQKWDAERRAEEAKQQHEHEQHLAKAKSLEAKYAPFLANGTRTLTTGRHSPDGYLLNGAWPKTKEPGPISLTALTVWNALSDAKMFVKVATASWNDRPKAGWQNLSEDEAKKRLEEFNCYASAWQELGLLDK